MKSYFQIEAYLGCGSSGHWAEISAEMDRQTKRLPSPGRELAEYLLGARGKGLRACLLLLCNGLFGKLSNQAYPLAAALELTHAASLLHDDIQDGSEMRRGRPCAYLCFGVKEAMLTGDALLAAALRICTDCGFSISQVYSGAVEAMVHGQIMETNPSPCPELYRQIIFKKTGSLMGAACEMGAVLAGQSGHRQALLRTFGQNLGAAYQIADDWRDFLPKSKTGKDQGRDILTGNITLPLRFYLDTLPPKEQQRLSRRIEARQIEQDELEAACQAVYGCALKARCREYLDSFLEVSRKSLSPLPPSQEKTILLDITAQISACLED